MPLINKASLDTPEIFARTDHDACLSRALVLLPGMLEFIATVHEHQQVLSKAVLRGAKDLDPNSHNYVNRLQYNSL
jgi:hypothetical protein